MNGILSFGGSCMIGVLVVVILYCYSSHCLATITGIVLHPFTIFVISIVVAITTSFRLLHLVSTSQT